MTDSKDDGFYQKLMKLIAQFSVPKDKKNEFGDFNFRDAEAIMRAVKPSAIELGLYIKTTKKIVKIDDRFYTEATASITDGEHTEESVAYAREPNILPKMSEPQVSGSAGSYAKKYALQDLLMIDDGKSDPDRQDNTSYVQLIDGKQLSLLRKKASEITDITGIQPDDFLNKLCELFKIQSIDQLAYKCFSQAMAKLVNWERSYEKNSHKNDNEQAKQSDRPNNNTDQNNIDIPWGQKQ